MTCREGATDLGAYVLGALDPVESRRMEQHVLDCPACATELEELAALPPLLATVPLGDLTDGPVTPSPDLYDRVAAAAAAERPEPARGRRWLLIAAALLVVVGAGAGITSWVLGAGEVTRTVVAGPVHMSVTVTEQGDGTALDVSVAGVPPHTNCTLVVEDSDGDRHLAGEWAATYEGKAWFKGWSDVDRSDVEDVVLLGSQGQELVRVPL